MLSASSVEPLSTTLNAPIWHRSPASTLMPTMLPNSFACLDSRWRLWFAHQLLRVTPWSVMPLVRHLNARRMYSPQTSRDDIRLANDLLRASTHRGYQSRIGMLREYDLRPRLRDLAAPVLFLAGDRDTLIPSVEQARLMHAFAPRATMRILEGHGHACLVAPDLDLAAILDEWIGC